jgi:predicted phosphodiesterase
VRLLLISDIHSNLEALEACLASAPAYDSVVNLGDIVGYGASPNQVTERSRALGSSVVRGNHDKAVTGLTDLRDFNPIAGLAALWTRDQLTPDNLEWLRVLPPGPLQVPTLEGVQFVHGSPLDEDEYLVTAEEASAPLQQTGLDLTFFGHTHLQGGFYLKGGGNGAFQPQYRTASENDSCVFHLESGFRYLINPGSVGQPRDGDWRAAFAVFDSSSATVTFLRVPYNLAQAQQRILDANLPPRLASRLAAGR